MTTPRCLETKADKSSIRRQALAWRAALDPAIRAERSTLACARVAPMLRGIGPVGLFASTRGELDLDALVSDPDIEAAYPRTNARTRALDYYRVKAPPCSLGAFGIREPSTDDPISSADLAAVLVPGLAFSRTGHRVGFGGGFFDRFLATLHSETLTIGIGFDEQLVDRVPVDPWDVPLMHVVTDNQTVTVTTTGPGAVA